MAQQPSLKPADIAVALRLAQEPEEGYESLSVALGISVGSAHNAVTRLQAAGLVLRNERVVDRPSLLELLLHGIRFVFYAHLGPEGRGVPTAHAAPPLSEEILADTAYVWPSANGSVRGTTLTPLYPGAPGTARSAPRVYRALALIDAIRVGRARERKLAERHLRGLVEASHTADESS